MLTATVTLTLHVQALHLVLANRMGVSATAAAQLAAAALPTIINRLGLTVSQPAEAEQMWATCQHWYQTQVHVCPEALEQADPDRTARRQLTQLLLGLDLTTALTAQYAPAAQTRQLLECYVLIVLASAGQCAAATSMNITEWLHWLQSQVVGPASAPAATAVRLAAPARPTADEASVAAAPAAATIGPKGWQLTRLLRSARQRVVAAAAMLGLLGAVRYQPLLMGSAVVATAAPAQAADAAPVASASFSPAAPARGAAGSAAPNAAASSAAELTAAAAPALAAVASAPAVVPVKAENKAENKSAGKPAAVATSKAAGTALPDTIGNAKLATLIGGKFDAHKGTYTRDSGVPLMLKLPRRTTLMVGVNSTESLLYKRLASPDLTIRQALDIDRLMFGAGQAKLDMEGAQQLGNVASLLKTFPRARLVVFGSAEPTEAQSLTLALARAQAVVAELVKQGVPSSALQAQGRPRTGAAPAHDPDYKRRASLYLSSLE